ncbi:MAG: TAXI family TRAP transporter solute-binding subunit [Ignavibacteriales bacterium]
MRLRTVAAVVLCSLIMCGVIGCGSQQKVPAPAEKPAAPAGPAPAKREPITVAGSSTGGTWYIMCGAISTVLNKYMDTVEASPKPSGGSVENCRNIQSGDTEMGLAVANVAYGAYQGADPWKDAAIKDLRAMFNTYINPLYIGVPKESKIQSVTDLKGKKIGGGPPGGSETLTFTAVLKAVGIDPSSVTIAAVSDTERAEALRNGQVDAAVWLLGPGAPVLSELCTTKDVRFLPLDPAVMDKLHADYPYMVPGTITKGMFKGVDQDIPAIVIYGIMCTSAKWDEQKVYQITKTIFEHIDEISTVAPLAKGMTPENAVKGLPLPLHSGAEKYFKEVGALK